LDLKTQEKIEEASNNGDNETVEFEVEGETVAPKKSKRFNKSQENPEEPERKTSKKIVKWTSRSTISKVSKSQLEDSNLPTTMKKGPEISVIITEPNNIEKNDQENQGAKKTLNRINKSQPYIRNTKGTISKNKECFKSLNNISLLKASGENKTQWSLIENFMNPLRDSFLKIELENKKKEDLDKFYDRYWYDQEISQVKKILKGFLDFY